MAVDLKLLEEELTTLTVEERLQLAKWLVDSVLREPHVLPVDAVVDREAEAFRHLHPTLLRNYPGEFVAIQNGVMVDRDLDQVALYLRVKKQFPSEFVWIAPVGDSPEETYHIRSPRLVRE